ncbi:MAG TPA: hypothetical protein VMA31_13255 [Bryobacteraceae bacterium]|nr:hypothetical protein [Bryobacteraceae bacterium]
MFQKILAAFAILALSAAFAGTVPVPGGGSYTITLSQPSVVSGTQLKAGDYRLKVMPDKITIGTGKNVVEVKAKVETGEQKFSATAIRYAENGGQPVVTEIRLGGTKTKLILQ